MFRTLWGFLLAAALSMGCGSSQSDPGATSSDSPAAAAAQGPGPDQAVQDFMTAFKTGDDDRAASMVTQKAREEAARKGISISPPGSKSMQFQVGTVEYVTDSKDGAHVSCKIADQDEEGGTTEYEVLWVLRKEASGWRIAGVAMKVFDDQPPVIYNFEDQDDMERKKQLVEEEMVRRSTAILQASQPKTDTTKQK